jgi:hypothetical protein
MSLWKVKSRFCFNIRHFKVAQDGFRYNQRGIALSRNIHLIAIFTPYGRKNMGKKSRVKFFYGKMETMAFWSVGCVFR